jgi:spore germination cell wall hydrolase CwlJ-like protein
MTDLKTASPVLENGANGKRLSLTALLAAGLIASSAVPANHNPPLMASPAPAIAKQAPTFDRSLLALAAFELGPKKSKPRISQIGLWSADDVAMPTRGLSREEHCLATAIYFEARGEPVKGQKAVAEVIMTRAGSGRYPGSICGVVYQNSHRHLACQFTFTCDGKADRPQNRTAWNLASRIAVAAMTKAKNKRPITKWATHYHATYVNPRWASKLHRTAKIGTHIFYREG